MATAPRSAVHTHREEAASPRTGVLVLASSLLRRLLHEVISKVHKVRSSAGSRILSCLCICTSNATQPAGARLHPQATRTCGEMGRLEGACQRWWPAS